MSDKILSQAEIEALMSSLSVEQDDTAPGLPETVQPTRPVKVYDFRRPDKFSKDHLRALRILHGSFARALGASLTSYLRSNVQVRLTMVEQVTYEEYIRSLPAPTVLYATSLAPLPGQMVCEINLPIVLTIVDRLLGGFGIKDTGPRELTEIELSLARTVGNMIASSLLETWRSLVPVKPVLQEPVLTPEFVQVTLPSEITVMLVFETTVVDTAGTVSMCIPHALLQPVLDKLTSQIWQGGGGRPDEAKPEQLEIGALMAPVIVPVAVELGRTVMRLGQVKSLAEGQVIRLDTSANSPLRVRVGDHVKFMGRPGVLGRNLAVQLTRVVGKEAKPMGSDPAANGMDAALFDDGRLNGDGGQVNPAAFTPLAGDSPIGEAASIDLLLDVMLQVSVELGRSRMAIGELLALRPGSVIELDKLAGEPADILVNGTRIARGEVVVVDEKFGVRVMDIVSTSKRVASLG